MFGASLLSMMIHSGESDSASESWSAPRKLASKSELAAHLSDYREEQKEIPVIGRSGPEHRSMIDIIKKWDDRAGGSGEFGWGRVPVRFLVDQFLQGRHDLPASAEYIDLGTPLTLAGPVHNSFISDCDALLKKVGKRSPQVTVAIVDRGDESPGAEPEHFNHRIEHVDKTDIVFSDHASQVLLVTPRSPAH